jgi:hypothetical protein
MGETDKGNKTFGVSVGDPSKEVKTLGVNGRGTFHPIFTTTVGQSGWKRKRIPVAASLSVRLTLIQIMPFG